MTTFSLTERTARQPDAHPIDFDGAALIADTPETARRYLAARRWYWQHVMRCRLVETGDGFTAHDANSAGALVGECRIEAVPA